MEKEIREAIQTTLVIENKQSIDIAVKKIMDIVSPPAPKEEKPNLIVLAKPYYKSKDGTIKKGIEINGQFYLPKEEEV